MSGDRELRPSHHDWYYVVEPDGGRPPERITAGDGRVLTRRRHGYGARVCVQDASGGALPVATLLRAAAAAGRALERSGDGTARPLTMWLGPSGTAAVLEAGPRETLRLDGAAIAAEPTRHRLEAKVEEMLRDGAGTRGALAPFGGAPQPACALFFESIMASDLPHNASEISQGVLHMLSALRGSHVRPLLVDLKMPAGDPAGSIVGMSKLPSVLARGPVQLVCLTLLEDYFDGAARLIAELRALGCQAHVAVGGVMPTLSPEHVAAHLPGVSFVCRGAGERFVPELARIVGSGDVTTAWSPEQCDALLGMDGLLAIDRAGQRLLAGNPAQTLEVAELDAVELDLSYVEPRHIEGGIEISTARGCEHHCAFCSIIGRGRYRARTADGVASMLEQYGARFHELFGAEVPPSVYRVHISDDDFGCDGPRAAAILQQLRPTPFRLSSMQVSVADLCLRRGRTLLAEPDTDLCPALSPEAFADHGREVAAAERQADYRTRSWSSYLQIGVESFADRELVRLGKGYRVSHIRVVVHELDRRGIHLDGYFILSNSETTADDLVASLEEVSRLKLRYPHHFHVRYPAVPRLVSYFPSLSHRKKLRAGTSQTMKLRRTAVVPGHPEYDYPFVDQDIPGDPWVRCATEQSFLSDGQFYTASLVALRERYRERVRGLPAGPERALGEQHVRRLDDAPRRLVFELLSESRRRGRDPGDVEAGRAEQQALAAAREMLGADERWLKAYRRFEHEVAPRLVVIPTWQCELRCRYCYVAKQGGRSMTPRTLERAIDLLLSSQRPKVMLQFFGGEPLVRFDLVQHGIEYATAEGLRRGCAVSFLVSSNGVSLDEDKLSWLGRHPVKLELSLDGDRETHNYYRRAKDSDVDSYGSGIPSRVEAIEGSGLPYDVIMVVHPVNVDRMLENFVHIANLGFRRIQVNFGLGAQWSEGQQTSFAAALFGIGKELRARWAAGDRITMVNLEHKPLPMRLNGEITVDHDGTIYGGNGFLHETPHKARFVIGHLDDLGSFDRYWLDAPDNDFLLEWTYPPDVTANNLEVGRIMTSFVRWMQRERIGPA